MSTRWHNPTASLITNIALAMFGTLFIYALHYWVSTRSVRSSEVKPQ